LQDHQVLTSRSFLPKSLLELKFHFLRLFNINVFAPYLM
jgi:hypothetical protein